MSAQPLVDGPTPVLHAGSLRVFAVLAGLEAGMLGAVCLVLSQVLWNMLAGKAAWAVPISLVRAAFGEVVYRNGPVAAASAGVALQLFGGGLVGIFFGLTQRLGWASRRTVLLGLVYGLGWYYLAYEVLLRRVGLGPYAALPRLSLMPGHVVFGCVLATYPRFLRSLRGDAPGGR